MPKKWKKVYWEDVKEGEDIGSYELEMSAVKISGGASATRDSNPGHHDTDWCRKTGLQNIIVNIMQSEGLLCRLATDWSGPTGDIVRVRFNIGESCYAGDMLKVWGKVVKKYIGDESDELIAGRYMVDLQIDSATQHDTFCDAQVSLALPSREPGEDYN